MNYATFHSNAIFDGFGMGSSNKKKKSRVTSLTQA
jgi:hypothetical protein